FTSGCIEVVSGGVPSLWTDVLVSRVDTYQEGWLFPSIRATINISHATDLSLYNNTSSMLDGKVLIVPADIVDEIRAMYPKMIVYSLNSYANDLILDEISIDGVKGYRIREYLGSNSTFFVPAMINGLPVMEISGHFFYNSEIINYEVESGSQYFASYNGVLYSADYSTLITVPVYYPASSLATHPLTRKIGDSAFLYNLTIKHVILNEGLQEIGDYAFSAMPTSMDYIYGESQLESVVLPDTITTIGKEAFRMTKIRNWNWPDGLISIGEGAFSETIWNEPIVLPDNLKSIGNKAFFEAVFPEIFLNAGLIHIGSEAIWIKGELVIPSSVETFGSYAVSATKLIFLGQTPPEYHIDYNNPIIMIGDYTTFTIVVPESALEVYLQADDFIRYSDYIVPNIESDEVIVRIQLEPGRWTSMIKSNGSGLGVLSEPTRSGYAFAGWQLLVWKTDGSYEFVDLPTDLILDEDTIIVAVWEKDNSTLDIIETESFTFSMASIGYEHSLLFTPDQLHTDYELRLATDDFDVSPYGFPYIILYVYTTTGELVDQVNSTHGDNSNNMSTAYYDITLPDATQEYVFVFSGAKYNVDVLGTIMPVE
ncbi:MAG: leucine-rich repeat domain-containing protein, partial [Bacilli bacterium]|nr:leucine-rich repeat domain-containing protein [Bacilli bacterium]